MPWEALNKALGDLKAQVEYAEPFWLVRSEKDSFWAHPAFLDSHRTTGTLAAMVGGDATVLRNNRVVTNGQLEQEMPLVHKELGPSAAQYTDVSDHIRLLRHWQSAKNMGVALGAPGIVLEASQFAAQYTATCADFVHAHAAYLAVGQSLQLVYKPAEHQQELTRRYNLALAAAAGAQPLLIKDQNAWATHSASFVTAVQQQAAQLTFGSPQAVVEHALKHLPRGESGNLKDVNEQRMDSLVQDYLTEARDKITDTGAATVTSALDQCAGSRTYYFGEVRQGVTMVAVNHTSLAWISTYYAVHRT